MKTKIFCDSADIKVIKKFYKKSLVTGCAAKPTNKKIPEPIMFPVTIEVASKIPRTLLEFDMN